MSQRRFVLGLDIGSNSVGSAWIDCDTGEIVPGLSVFPAGVDESDDKRGDPKNAKRRMTRRTRITLARRAARKRALRLKLISVGLLPPDAAAFKLLLEQSDPWELRRKGLTEPLTPHEFGRVILHLAQRRGALGLNISIIDEGSENEDAALKDGDGKVKAAIGKTRAEMLLRSVSTFGEMMCIIRAERTHALSQDASRPRQTGPSEYRDPIRNRAGSYEFCADRALIRDEFTRLWRAQRELGGVTGALLDDELRRSLDDPNRLALDQDPSATDEQRQEYKRTFREGGLLFGQRRQSWDLGTLGRCDLHPTERCVPHADMHASRYLVVETVNNLKIIERGTSPRALTVDERCKIKAYLCGPLGKQTKGKFKGKPKTSVTPTDLRDLMGWGRATKTSQFRFNVETDEDRQINTDWFSREIIHGVLGGPDTWKSLPSRLRDGLNRAILKFDPAQDGDAEKLRTGVIAWGGLNAAQAEALIAAWRTRPKIDAKRLNLSRRAVRNVLQFMDREAPWTDRNRPGQTTWLTEIAARKLIAECADFRDVTTGEPMAPHTRRRYATGTKGATSRDRYYMKKHILMKGGKELIDSMTGKPLAEPPPAPMIGNPVVRKAIHEVRRHIVDFMIAFERRPDAVYIELAREARMGKMDADRLLFRNRIRNRIRNDIVQKFGLDSGTFTQQRVGVDRVVLAVQQGETCPLCGSRGLTPRIAAEGTDCELAHIVPRGSGGHNGLSNLVLAHIKCNRDMGRRTPRELWSGTLKGGFDEGLRWIEGIYGEVERPRPSEMRKAEGNALWLCYFNSRDDKRKLEQFSKDVKDIQGMTERQAAATTYATRQVMAYIADALYGGRGLPERATGQGLDEDRQRIFATDGMWTRRLRDEWGLHFDPHHARAKNTKEDEKQGRREKNRADHRHHAVDAILTAYCTQELQKKWDKREKDAIAHAKNPADEEELEHYRREHRLDAPKPFPKGKEGRDEFYAAVKNAVFGSEEQPKPVCHRPVKRKLIDALHEETLFGPVLDRAGKPTGNYSGKKSVLALTPDHLRMPAGWDALEAKLHDGSTPPSARHEIRRTLAAKLDPEPGKPGLVRDRSLRAQLRRCLRAAGLDLGVPTPKNDRVVGGFSTYEIKKVIEAGKVRHDSGVPIRSVVLLRTMNDPVLIDRRTPDYATGRMVVDEDPAATRAYVGGNNHHIEIRASRNKRGVDTWKGEVITGFEAAQRKLAKLKVFKAAKIPRPTHFAKLPDAEKARLRPILSAIERENPIVDRRDWHDEGARFVMSLCEGEMLWMKHKATGETGFFVVAKLDKPQTVVLVPHWDARAAKGRKDSAGTIVPGSARQSFSVTPSDLLVLAPPGKPHAVKVRVSPLGSVHAIDGD